ncbi:hypothetical protein [Amycolatopsis solani]|uniref:hypothetical protein n=1 Tax=Amycolatopsis solani TaxID=3028615 RepID=UPI0025B18443|nr:hypothetical protein [Amycolatopsis sp. MEP2-6]
MTGWFSRWSREEVSRVTDEPPQLIMRHAEPPDDGDDGCFPGDDDGEQAPADYPG